MPSPVLLSLLTACAAAAASPLSPSARDLLAKKRQALALKAPYPLIPGFDFVASSLDANYLDVLGPSALSPQFVKLPVVALTFDLNQTVYGLDGRLYSIPDQAAAVTSQTNGQCSQYSSFSSSSFNFSLGFLASFALNADLSLPFIPLSVGGALSFSAQLAVGFQTNSESAVGISYCNVSSHAISMAPAPVVSPDPDFAAGVKAFLSPNPRYEQNPQAWLSFFSNWGTVVPLGAEFGGVAGSLYSMNLEAFRTQFNGSIAAAANASAALASFVVAAGGATVNGNMATASSSFFQSSSNETVWRGGSCVPGSSGCTWNDWYQTVFDSPATLFVRYAPLSPYVALVDPVAGEGCHDAISNVTAIAAMQGNTKPLLQSYRSVLSQVSIPPIEECSSAALTLPQCQPNPNVKSGAAPGICCAAQTSGGIYPNDATANAITQASNAKTAEIDAALNVIANAAANNWLSLEAANNVTSTLTSSAFAWALQTKQAQCSATFVPNSVCPSACTPVQCGEGSCLLKNGGACCLCPAAAYYDGCCNGNGGGGGEQLFLCPSQCSASAPYPVQTFTATWPTIFDPFYQY